MLIEHKDKTGTGLSHFRLRFEQQKTEGEDQQATT
jgi:type IV pilus assembly protein PilN